MSLNDDEEELELLKLANEHGKFAIPILTQPLSEPKQLALERLQQRRWITLIDVTPIANMTGLYRIFLLSPEARAKRVH